MYVDSLSVSRIILNASTNLFYVILAGSRIEYFKICISISAFSVYEFDVIEPVI